MSLTDWQNKIKEIQRAIEGVWFWPLVVVLATAGAFGLGRWSKIEELRPPVTIESAASQPIKPNLTDATLPTALGKVVGSKNGNKYHLPWCSGAARIKEENKVWFASAAAAAAAGYTPAANCPGL